MLFFSDDILVYSPNLDEHLEHLEAVFKLMHHHTLFAKKKKNECAFVIKKVEYLRHCILSRE